MTELEVKQMCANMQRPQLLNLLTAIETAYNKVFPWAMKVLDLREEKKQKEDKLDGSQRMVKIGMIAAIGLAIIGLLLLITSGMTDKFSGFFRKVFGIIGVVSAVIALAASLSEKKTVKRLTTEIADVNAKIPEAEKQLAQAKEENKIDLQLLKWVCPAEASNPKYLRTFVSYFENGRADSMKEAYALFEEMLHREKMEQHALEQLRAARAAEAAAYEAVSAANRANSTANQAKVSADWAAYWTRFKD